MDYSKWKKYGIPTLSVVGGLYALFLLSPLAVSPILNSYTQNIQDAIKTNAGFESSIDNISFVTSWNLSAGVKVKNLSLSIPEADKPFLQAENAGVRLALLPLLCKKIQIDSISAKSLNTDIVVKDDGNFLLLDAIPKQNSEQATSFELPFGLKLSNHLPNIKVLGYKFLFIDAKTDKSYFIEGEKFNLTDFILDKKFKLDTSGKIVLDGEVASNYNLKIFNNIMPKIQLQNLVFPKEVSVAEEAPKDNFNMPFNVIEILKLLASNKLSADFVSDIKTFGTLKQPHFKGHFKAEAISVAVDGKKLPESYADFQFKGNKTEIDSVFFSSFNTEEKTQIIGNVTSGKKPSIDMTLRSNAKFNNVINLVDSIFSSFGVNDFNSLSATGGIDADFNINSDLKKVASNGYLKILPSSLTYGLYNVSINNINADINLENNNIDIKNAGFSILGNPLKLSGSIKSDAETDLKLITNDMPIKGLLTAFGQAALLKDNDIEDGGISLDASLKGKLTKPQPSVSANIRNVSVFNKPSDTKLTLKNSLIKLLYDGEKASGDVGINSLIVKNPALVVAVPETNVIVDNQNINIKNSYILLNNSRIDIKGFIKDYMTDKLSLDVTANGKLKTYGIAAALPAEFRNLISYKGELPLNVSLSGSSKVQNIKAEIDADTENYITLADIDKLKGGKTKIHVNMELIGDSLTFSNTGISSDKALIAKLSGDVTKLYSSPKLNLNIAVPNEISFPIWGVSNSNITANGSVTLAGALENPQMRGTVNLVDISMKDIDFAITDLVADLSGSILNGSATARQFKCGGIVAQDLAGNFSLQDYSKFYLNNLEGSVFDGKVKGRLSYDINTAKTGVEISGEDLNSTKAVYGAVGIKNALTGVLGFNAKLAMQGITDKDIINSMRGNVDFTVKDGRFVSIGRLENLVAAQNVSSNSVLKAAISALTTASTIQEADKFKSITGNLTLSDGSANLDKILVSGPLMSYYVTGVYNILPNTANLIILGRLEAKVVSALGVLGELSADKLLSYIPKFGAMTSKILNQLTSDPANENTALIPALSDGSTTFKDFKVVFSGSVESASSVRSFKWLSVCDTTKMNLKDDLKNATEAVKTNINTKIENAKTNAEAVKNNVNNIIETQKNKATEAKADFEQTKTDIQNAKTNAKQNAENLKNLFQNALKNSQNKVETAQPAAEEN
ncbi:MAG: AsmA-like C-terminal region-containing protein [Candidatus Gastranaerophilaceae bacterium]